MLPVPKWLPKNGKVIPSVSQTSDPDTSNQNFLADVDMPKVSTPGRELPYVSRVHEVV